MERTYRGVAFAFGASARLGCDAHSTIDAARAAKASRVARFISSSLVDLEGTVACPNLGLGCRPGRPRETVACAIEHTPERCVSPAARIDLALFGRREAKLRARRRIASAKHFSALWPRPDFSKAHAFSIFTPAREPFRSRPSRGYAARACLVESSREALAAIRANIGALGEVDRTRVVGCDVRQAVPRLAQDAPFDLVLADPPWALVDSGQAIRTLADIVDARMLSPMASVVLEHSSRTPPPEIEGLTLIQNRFYGDTALSFYKPAILGRPRAEDAGLPSE